MTPAAIRTPTTELARFCAAIFESLRLGQADAALTAGSLVEADLRGVSSHGVIRTKIYADRLAAGVVNATPHVRAVRETRTTAVVDGDNGMGQIVGAHAMRLAIAKAEAEGGPSVVSVRGSNHYGTAAWFAEMACPHDMIGLSTTISGINHMVPWGGAETRLGNNPFAVAFPRRGGPAIVLDMACSVAARGKIMVAAKEGQKIPEGWAVGPDGAPTTDAATALAGFVSPVGGPKGYALTLTMGLLSTMLSGAGFGSEVTHQYEDLETPQNTGHLMIALPIAAFEDVETYLARIEKAAQEVLGVRRAAGVERIYLPGQREAELRDARRRSGVPLPRDVLRDLDALGAARGVAPLGRTK